MITLQRDAIVAQLSPALRSALAGIHIFDSLPSTNEWLLNPAPSQSLCQTVCLAEQQTAGRGRRGRVWQSPPVGNIYCSLRWCFDAVPAHYGWLGLVTGVAVAEALMDYGLRGHCLKWPNDVYYQGRKLGGILLQTAPQLEQVVIGIGLNTGLSGQQAAIDQPWADVGQILQQPIDRNRLIALLLARLLPALQAFPAFEPALFQARWQEWDYLWQRPVSVLTPHSTLHGIAQGLDAQGQLQVQLADGSVQSFAAADISVRREV